MKDNNLYCYTTNEKFLAKKSKKICIDIDKTKKKHVGTAIVATTQGIISTAITLASNFSESTFSSINLSNKKVLTNVKVKLTFKPIMELDITKNNKSGDYQKILNEIDHDDFSIMEDSDYGKVLKFTTFLYIKEETNAKKILPDLSAILLDKIVTNNLPNKLSFKIPVGNHIFDVNIEVFFDS